MGTGRIRGRVSGSFSHDEHVETQGSFNEVFMMIKKVNIVSLTDYRITCTQLKCR